MFLDTADPARLEAALEALPRGTAVRVSAGGAAHIIHRVPGGWYLPGDLAVASADVAQGRPDEAEVLDPFGDDPAYDEGALLQVADDDPEEAAGLRAWASAAYDAFFRWVPAARYAGSTDPDGQGLEALVLVDGDLIAQYRASVLPPGRTPPHGAYVLQWDGEGRVAARRISR